MLTNATRIDVSSGGGTYPVLIGAGLSSQLASLEPDLTHAHRALVVSSSPIWRLHGDALKTITGTSRPLLIPDGERAKTLATVRRIYHALVTRHMDRSATVVAFGGGVVGDVAGFAAATYLRGIRVVQIPTTLLAQVDSSVGGKTGVNLVAGKNLVGAFHPPALVVCDPLVLKSLPLREFRSGLYEVVKYGVIASRPLLDRVSAMLPAILKQDPDVLTPLIADCCRIKALVVGSDEREGGIRRILNFGHTIGHALEAITHYRRFRHGEAIAHGMIAAARLSAARGLMSADDEAYVEDVIARVGPLPRVRDLRSSEALSVLRRDKKVVNGRLHFVLAHGIGDALVAADVGAHELQAAMRSLGMRP